VRDAEDYDVGRTRMSRDLKSNGYMILEPAGLVVPRKISDMLVSESKMVSKREIRIKKK